MANTMRRGLKRERTVSKEGERSQRASRRRRAEPEGKLTITEPKSGSSSPNSDVALWHITLKNRSSGASRVPCSPPRFTKETPSGVRRSSRKRKAVCVEDPKVEDFFKELHVELHRLNEVGESDGRGDAEDGQLKSDSDSSDSRKILSKDVEAGTNGEVKKERVDDVTTSSPRKPVIKDDPEQHTESDSEDEENIEKKRLKNIEDNARFLASLQIKTELGFMPAFSKKIPVRRLPKPPKEILPRRASRRLQRITPEGEQLPEPTPEPIVEENERPRKPAGPFPMADYVWDMLEDQAPSLSPILKRLSGEDPTSPSLNDVSQDKFLYSLSSTRMRHFVKATPNRIFSVAFHPSESKKLALAGDKWGYLAFWDVDRGQAGMHTFIPHSRPINHIVCPATDHSTVYTASYDGTLRATRLEQAVFEEIYQTEEEDDIRLTRFDLLSESSLIVSQGDGCVAVVDTRTEGKAAESLYGVHDRLIKCVNVHPQQKHYFLTCTNNGQVSLWDLRHMKPKNPKCVTNLPHAKSVDAAHFSPVNGSRILTTCYDNTLNIFDSSDLTDVKHQRVIRHDNQTGRWLTNFRAEWHPQREDFFVIGSMHRPRQIELFSTNGRIVHTFGDLTSVCSLNAFHPTLTALVGANSSGRLVAYLP